MRIDSTNSTYTSLWIPMAWVVVIHAKVARKFTSKSLNLDNMNDYHLLNIDSVTIPYRNEIVRYSGLYNK